MRLRYLLGFFLGSCILALMCPVTEHINTWDYYGTIPPTPWGWVWIAFGMLTAAGLAHLLVEVFWE